MLRIIKILLVLSVAMFGLLGVIGNLTDWEGTIGALAATTSMSTFEGGAESWRATNNTAIITAGALYIVVLKGLFALLCFAGTWKMWGAYNNDSASFAKAKTYALAGCGVAMFMLFTGWIVIAETWFELWRSEALREAALGAAFRYFAMIGLIALFVTMPDGDVA